jgi:site-specific DNA-methyltransferase (adenine-specific)
MGSSVLNSGWAKKVRLYNEDCLVGMSKRLKKGTVDIVVTSPPYNIGVKYSRYKDNLPLDDYLKWLTKWAEQVNRVMKESGSLFLNIGSKPSAPDIPFRVQESLSKVFHLQNVVHWIKSIYIESNGYGDKRSLNVGHYKPINSNRFLNDTHEYVFHFTKSGKIDIDRLALGVPYKDQSNIKRWKAGGAKIRCRGNCWFVPYETIQNRATDRPHPASFPPKLAENCIRLHGHKKGLTVLDPFMGIGNTGIACRKLSTAFIGFEIDPVYFGTAEGVILDTACEKA